MSENPLLSLFQSIDRVSKCLQTHLSNFIGKSHDPSPINRKPLLSTSSSWKLSSTDVDSVQLVDILKKKGQAAAPVTKEELGRATWTFLHTLAAQYPDNPTKQQKKDVKDLECADHFKEVLRVNPVQAGSHAEFSQWLCHVHNVVNRSLGKSVFPCERVDARWGKLECENRACDVQGTLTKFD
ncbi:hypothetical protein CDL15_Pgr028513 [Punica granatum]|uniref:Sulfhydryl oxidase n=1 Tax=Punica granatum TaxID=22663 RepID=A0A218VWL3_PUNGR|nr:hypothetical protein CDL15_Pgr028513 [Punica granatum]